VVLSADRASKKEAKEEKMDPHRRHFLQSTAALAAVAAHPAAFAAPGRPRIEGDKIDWKAVRDDFPWLRNSLWLSASDYHPLGVHAQRMVDSYYRWRVGGPAGGGSSFSSEMQQETKELFGKTINARPDEIAFIHNTTEGENLVVAGMDLARRKGNVVLDDLHYQASKFIYHMLEREGGIELRVVRSRKDGYWRTEAKDMIAAIDDQTLLVSIALVSNINGFLHDAKTTSDAAHAHGAHVYADIIQGAGAVPIDVKALGIDFAAAGTYKWLQGDMGFGFLYVKEDLQGTVVKRTRYGVRQFDNPNDAQADSRFDLRSGAVMYESSGTLPGVQGMIAHAALEYIHELGIANIHAHNQRLVERLQREMPGLGYPPITPPGTATPVVSFLTPNQEKTRAKLDKAFGYFVVALKRWEFTHPSGETHLIEGVRIGPSVYNNDEDLDRLLNALA
jgi:selenocysteine lyase/cysteine desulfurase